MMGLSRKIVHQTLACSSVIINLFVIGLGFGWVAPTLVKLGGQDAPLTVTAEQASWIASISEVGKIFGPIVTPWLVDNFGRKFTTVLSTVLVFAVWLFTIFAASFYTVCAIRVIFGLSTGVYSVVSGIYVIENCSPNFRGIMSSIGLLTFFAGIFVEFVIATYLTYMTTAVVNTALAACAFASLYYCVETPYFLTMKGKRREAEKNFTWLSGDASPTKVVEELSKIEKSLDEEKQKRQSLRLLFSSTANMKGIILVVGMQMCAAGTGCGAFNAYGTLIFSPSETLTVNEFMILYGAAQLIAVGMTPFLIERLDRRAVMIGCFGGVAGSNACSYLLTYAHTHGYNMTYYPWLIFSSLASCSMFFALMSPANYALVGELLPFSVRAIGTSMGVTAYSMATFAVVKLFLPIAGRFGMETNFLMYAAVALFTTVLLFYVLPETRGKSLHELQNLQSVERRAPEDDVEKGNTSL